MSPVWARLAAEVMVAAMTTVEATEAERFAHVHHRVRNAWLLQAWFWVDKLLSAEPDDDRLALYLGLGWTQATTTWQWPATERWIGFLAGEPPAGWLPRSQWHLCWLLHHRQAGNAASAEHRQALDDALSEGLADGTRPGVAATLRELLAG